MASTTVRGVDVSVKRLRCLICDDNLVLLNLQAMLLKRRFSHVLDGPPIAVDGGLKAIQALRQEVFDLVFLDIQMSHISGLDVCMRIRVGTDWILAANRSVIILATTSAVGPTATAVYRTVGMSGVLPKPVQAAHLADFLGTLIKASSPRFVPRGDGVMVRAAQEPNDACVFFLPLEERASVTTALPDICDGRDFADAIYEQTKASLRQVGQMSRSISAPQTVSPLGRPSTLPLHSSSSSSLHSSGRSSNEELPPSSHLDDRARGNSVSISSSVLKRQLAREVAQMEAREPSIEPFCESSETDGDAQALGSSLEPPSRTHGRIVSVAHASESVSNGLEPESLATRLRLPKLLTAPPSPALRPCRPLVNKRASSPAWLAHWLSAIELPEALVLEELQNLNEPILGLGGASISSFSLTLAPNSPLLAAEEAPNPAAAPNPQVSHGSITVNASEDSSERGSGTGSLPTSSRSTRRCALSPCTPSEVNSSSSSYFPRELQRANAVHGSASLKHRPDSNYTMHSTSTGTSAASSPSLEAPPLLFKEAQVDSDESFTSLAPRVPSHNVSWDPIRKQTFLSTIQVLTPRHPELFSHALNIQNSHPVQG